MSRKFRLLPAGCLILLLAQASPLRAERPSTEDLLPAETLALFQIADADDLIGRLKATSLGRIALEPQIKRLIDDLYARGGEAISGAEDRLGAKLPEVLASLAGEISLAVVQQTGAPPASVLLIDLGPQRAVADTLLDRMVEALLAADATRTEETILGAKLTLLDRPGRQPDVIYFTKDQTLVLATTKEAARQVLLRWSGQGEDALSTNPHFQAIKNRSVGSEADRPSILFYIDPIGLAQGASFGNASAQLGLAILPTLGLDGVQAIGGTLSLATEQYDQLLHLHVLIDKPRTGVLDALALRTGETVPERWIPDDVARYVTFDWDIRRTYDELGKLVDSFRGEGSFARSMGRRTTERLGVDFEQDLVDAAAGRIIWLQCCEQPARLDGRSSLWAIKLKDAKAFRATFTAIGEKLGDTFEPQSLRGIDFYQRRPAAGEDSAASRPAQACFALVDEYFVVADRGELLKRIIAARDGGAGRLADSIDYKLVASKARRLSASRKPGLLMYSRLEVFLRHLYDLAGSADVREQLAAAGENSQAARHLHESLESHLLPAFEVLSKHLAPGGGVVLDDDTGWHYVGFTLRRK